MEHSVKHVAIILDGNRRWAKAKGMPAFFGHRAGLNKVKKLFDWILELGIKELTLYAFSIQNFKRSKSEVNFLMNMFVKSFKDLLKDERVPKHKVKVKLIGMRSMLPKKLLDAVNQAEEMTKEYDGYRVNFCIAYGGREEIVNATREVASKVQMGDIKIDDIDEKLIQDSLWQPSDPDIIIRTSGEVRTSNFLIWQQSYAEWFFITKNWPDFEKSDLESILKEYDSRQRRFGA